MELYKTIHNNKIWYTRVYGKILLQSILKIFYCLVYRQLNIQDMWAYGLCAKKLMPSSQTTFRGQPIYSVGQPKQVQLTNIFIKSVNLKLLRLTLNF